MVGRLTVEPAVCSEASSRRLRRQARRSFELGFDLNRRKATRLVRPPLNQKNREDSDSPARSGKRASLWTVEGALGRETPQHRPPKAGTLFAPLQKDVANVAGPTRPDQIDRPGNHSSKGPRSAQPRQPIILISISQPDDVPPRKAPRKLGMVKIPPLLIERV